MARLLLLPILALFAGLACAGELSCHRLTFRGEVANNKSFQKDLGMGLTFRMEPEGQNRGWVYEIGPTVRTKSVFSAYIYAVTPPWRGRHTTMLDTSYATSAQDAVSSVPHQFWFLLRPADASRASKALDQILWPKSDQAQQQAIERLGALPRGAGTLTVFSADFTPGSSGPVNHPEPGHFGTIRRIAFRVDLTVPSGFTPGNGIEETTATCPGKRQWPLGRP